MTKREEASMKKVYFIYIIISIICVVSIGIAVYVQLSREDDKPKADLPNEQTNEMPVEISIEEEIEQVKSEFENLFLNSINFQKNTVEGIKKIDDTKEIVYSAYNIKQEEDGKYNVNLNIPVINIQGEVAQGFNTITQNIFANKAGEVLENAEVYTIYKIDYMAYVNGDILSVAIKSTLKEGNSSQRVIVQTYNYNLKTGKKVTLNEMLKEKDKNEAEVNEKIEKQVSKAALQAQKLSEATGQSIYKRDLQNAIYITDNVPNFLVGKDGAIYIIYAYGNSNLTSELDVIKI